jgi:hypothetical protein
VQDRAEPGSGQPQEAYEVELAPRATRLRVVLILSLACWLLVILGVWLAARLL